MKVPDDPCLTLEPMVETELTPKSCLLISTCPPWHMHTPTHITYNAYTHAKIVIIKKDVKGMEDPEINTANCGCLTFNKSAKSIHEKEDSLPTNIIHLQNNETRSASLNLEKK